MTLSFLLLLAHLAARALALVGGRAYARVAQRDTFERFHLDAVVRRLHAKGKLGRAGDGVLLTLKRLYHVICALAHYGELRRADRWAGPPLSAGAVRRSVAYAVAHLMAHEACITAPDSS